MRRRNYLDQARCCLAKGVVYRQIIQPNTSPGLSENSECFRVHFGFGTSRMIWPKRVNQRDKSFLRSPLEPGRCLFLSGILAVNLCLLVSAKESRDARAVAAFRQDIQPILSE